MRSEPSLGRIYGVDSHLLPTSQAVPLLRQPVIGREVATPLPPETHWDRRSWKEQCCDMWPSALRSAHGVPRLNASLSVLIKLLIKLQPILCVHSNFHRLTELALRGWIYIERESCQCYVIWLVLWDPDGLSPDEPLLWPGAARPGDDGPTSTSASPMKQRRSVR